MQLISTEHLKYMMQEITVNTADAANDSHETMYRIFL